MADYTDIDKLRELEAAATPPPWRATQSGSGMQDERERNVYRGERGCVTNVKMYPVDGIAQADADLIAEGRNALPSLLAELVGLRTEVNHLRENDQVRSRILATNRQMRKDAEAERDALQAEVERLTAQVEAGRTINNQFADQSGRDGQALLRKDAEIRTLQARIHAASKYITSLDLPRRGGKSVLAEILRLLNNIAALGVDPQTGDADG